MKKLLIFFIGFIICFDVFAQQDSLWSAYYQNIENKNIAHKIILNYSSDHESDSIFKILINHKGLSKEDKNALYEEYFSVLRLTNKTTAEKNARNWILLHQSGNNITSKFKAYHNLSKILLHFKENEKALKVIEQESRLAELSGNKAYKIEALFNKGKCFDLSDNKTDAFKNYLDAYYFSMESNNKRLVEKSLNVISEFFASNKLYLKSIKYKKQELELFLKNNQHCDSAHYFQLLSELSDNLYDYGDLKEAKIYSDKVLSYCIRAHDHTLLLSQIAIIRSNYFETNNFEGLVDLYTIRFPYELDSLKRNNSVPYFRIRSLFYELKGQHNLAALYLDSAEYAISKGSYSPFIMGNFYNRKAEFYLRQNYPEKAISSLQKAYDITLSKKYYPFLKIITQNLDTAYTLTGNYQQAHLYRGLSMSYADSIRQMLDNDAIVLLEVENVEKQKELVQIQQEALIDRKHNLQYMLIVILIASSFIVLIIFSSVKIPDIVIRGLGYFVFIFFFEFIILLADNKIHHMTHGEPLKIMGLKIVLIAMLLPLHHWVEHKVVHYLLHHHILQHFRIDVWVKTKILRIKPQAVVVAVEENISEHNQKTPYNESE